MIRFQFKSLCSNVAASAVALALAVLAGAPQSVAEPAAGEAGAAAAVVQPAKTEAGGTKDPEIVLTPEEKTEKEARKACKVDICTAFRNPSAAGHDISCDVLKSWRKEQLVKMVSRLKVTWPYGPVRCTSSLKIKRDDLAKAVTEPKYSTTLDKHSVSCTVERSNDKPTEIKFEFSPKVDFANGKAVAAKMNWGKIEAPTLIKGAMWTATAADNTVNLLSSYLVTDINDFIEKKCDEVKDEWAARK
ncbi:MAG: hypothetical protein JNL45_07440 [Hyphomicrobium sp.]|jgi:hypothetical protein|nr:hypothetical protein [Hyphomicrobium sp.]